MVLSDGTVHFLKIKNILKQIYQNYLVALNTNIFVIGYSHLKITKGDTILTWALIVSLFFSLVSYLAWSRAWRNEVTSAWDSVSLNNKQISMITNLEKKLTH